MLKYGFDFADTVSAQIDATKLGFEINSTSGTVLTSSSAELFYNIQSSLPVLETFDRLDGSNDYVSEDATIGYYQSFTFDSDSSKSGSFYGQQLRYHFNEPVYLVAEDSSDLEAYSTPFNAYYITGSNSADGNSGADLLAYTAITYTDSQLPNTSSTTDLINNNNGYGPLVTSGSLLQSASGSLDPLDDTWYHLAYLTIDENDFVNEASIHEFSVRYHDTYHIQASDKVPELFGHVKNYNSSSFAATHFADEDGNPARLVPAWFTSSNSPGTQQLTFDTKAPELLSATALNVSDSDSDGNEDNYAGTFGITGDIATFTFELVFSEQLSSPTDLANALVWTIDSTHNTTGAAVTDLVPDPQVSNPVEGIDLATNDPIFTYTVTNAVSGLFDTTGKYHIELDDSNPLTDSSGTSIDFTAANEVLGANNPTLCFFGTCLYSHAPATLTGASVSPSLVSVLTSSSSAFNEFNLTLSFSEPVLFTPDQTLISTDAAQDAFTMDYYLLSNPNNSITTIESGQIISTDTYTQTIIAPLQPVGTATEDNGIEYYSQYVVRFDDEDIRLWARSDYGTTIGESSEVTIYFNDITAAARATDSSGSVLNINYLENFLTIDGAQPTILSTSAVTEDNTEIFMVDPANDQNVITKLKYQLITKIPAVASITAVAANETNSQNYNSSSPIKRHVQFNMTDLEPSFGKGIGMHILFRTTDNAFTNNDPATAPYYGAEGGIYISGADVDESGIGYHICPPFNKHLDRASSGMQHPELWTYNENRARIYYIAIPYAASTDEYLVEQSEISSYAPITVDFNSDDALSGTEPCVRTAFYNDGEGQYGYVVDSDQEEQHMVIANAMLQDTHGDTADLAMLPTSDLKHVYFDLYSKDYYADSWRKDLTITAEDLLTDLSTNLASSLHDFDGGISFQIDPAYLSIFASRFVNTINARFLDSVFLDDLTKDDLPAHNIDFTTKMNDLLNSAPYNQITASTNTESAWTLITQEDYFTPNYRNQTPDVLVNANDNRIVLSIGVHPAAIRVSPDGGTAFHPFETSHNNFLKMDPEFYSLYYGGDSTTNTEPAFDYTSRHLAYINFDLVYQLDIDPDTEEITGATLVQIVSPFSLLKHSFFESNNLVDLRNNGQSYTAVAASIADNVFRHNFYSTSGSSYVQHFLPVGIYCYDPAGNEGFCQNDHAQMLLPDPNDSANGYERTIVSPHYLHRTVLHFDASANNTALQSYTIDSADDDGFANSNPGSLLQTFMRLNDGNGYSSTYTGRIAEAEALPGAIGDYAYNSMLYNSFDRDHAYDYTYDTSSENFAYQVDMDGVYITDDNTQYKGFEQEYWGLSPYAESPDARADQILPNAFLLGGQMITPYHHHFLVKPYQFSGFTQQINSHLANPDYLINKNVAVRGLLNTPYYDGTDLPYTGAGSLNLYPNFAFPDSQDIGYNSSVYYNYLSSVNYHQAFRYRRAISQMFGFMIAHILSTSASYYQSINNFYNPYADGTNRQIDYGANLASENPLYFSGRTPGFYNTTSGEDNPIYGLMEYTSTINRAGQDSTNSGFSYRNDKGAVYASSPNVGAVGQVSTNSTYDGAHYAATINDSYVYDDNGKQRMFLPHHADDYDFDRGQIMANKLGFFLDDGIILNFHEDTSDRDYGYIYQRLFFPSDPAIITPETSKDNVDYVVTSFDSKGFGEVSNYYPLVLAEESLHTADNSWPVLLTRHNYSNNNHLELDRTDSANLLSGLNHTGSESQNMTQFDSPARNYANFPVALDKVFPEGYRYQLGFVNREELFMYDPSVGNGDLSNNPTINRFYSSAVGHFGYATQYSRLNRRSMQRYHNITSSQFLGDHLARFETDPSLGAGAHISNDIDNVFTHTPVNQGATGTNYGSYREGHYNLTTGTDEDLTDTWRHRTYSGTLRGYVLELRTNPVYTNQIEDYETSTNSGFASPNGNPAITRMQDLAGNGHPDGDPN